MMKRHRKLLALFPTLLCLACVPVRTAPDKPNRKIPARIEAKAGRVIPFFSVSIDANYDPRLDAVIYGYKLLPVVVKNMSLRVVPMDVKNDRWVVVTDRGQRYRALNSLKMRDERAWRELPEKMRALIDYPEVIPIDYSVTFDLLLPDTIDLQYFREIRYYSAAWRKEFILEKEY